VQNTRASSFDRAVSPVPFDVWLISTLQGYRWARADESFAFWALSYCDSPSSAFPLAGEPDLCVEVSVPIIGDRKLQALVRVAVVDTSKVASWRDIEPEMFDIHIVRMQDYAEADSLDVPSLSAIHACLAMRFDDWPTIDLKPAVSWTPTKPSPRTSVRFRITVANLGRRDATRAHVRIYIAIPLNDEDQKELRREWWPRIPAGKAMSLDISATLGRGDATIVVDASAQEGPKRLREVNSEDSNVIAVIPWSP